MLLRENRLEDKVANLKIMVTRGEAPHPGLPFQKHPTVCATAQEYLAPALSLYKRGMHLHLYDEGFTPPLARHKSLNYLYYLAARQAAIDNGCSEAVLMDGRGRTTETSAGSLLARSRGRWWTPKAKFRLTGITLRELSQILLETGQNVEEREARREDLQRAETVWVLNSLMGIMPAATVNGSPIADPVRDEAARLRDLLFERGKSESFAE
jgi:branched-chain amino acid aminotransferase/para-aminobenzoate synthetase component 1